ncbi:MAG: hypothetical protein JWM88_824 [Verrucomicrobia bacterium]|nr:hypothetical protein [Verrucomicrobiota bacterium]
MRRLTDAPACVRRAFFVLALLSAATAVGGPTSGPADRTPPAYLQFGKPDQEEGRAALAAFRQAGIPGQYYLEFDLRVLPRRGDERTLAGRLWGARNDQGAVTRISVTGANSKDRHLLVQNGEEAKVWSVDLGGEASSTTRIVDAFEPLLPGVELTAFDLAMPYLYWADATLEKLARVRSRPTHVFLFRPPPAWAAGHPEFSGVRAYLDTQFNVPVQTELIGRDGRVVRTLSLVDLAKVGDQYLPKSIDLRNEATRDKVRFQVTAAALNLKLPAALFEPGQLAEKISPPPAGQVQRVAP